MTYWYYTFERVGLCGKKYTGKAVAISYDKFFPLIRVESEIKGISKRFELKLIIEINKFDFDEMSKRYENGLLK